MIQLKHRPCLRKWIAFAPLLGLTVKDFIVERISLFKYLSWKDRLSIGGLYLAFWAGLLAGVWQIGLGFYEGPNYAATRIVVVDDVGTWRSESRHNTSNIYWSLGYHFTSSKGEKVSRRITASSDDVGARRQQAMKYFFAWGFRVANRTRYSVSTRRYGRAWQSSPCCLCSGISAVRAFWISIPRPAK